MSEVETTGVTETEGDRRGGLLATARSSRAARLAFDAAVLIGLTVVAFAVRRGGLPTNGLWFDDSWVAAGGILGKPANLMTVGSGQPMFTAGLMVWHAIAGSSLRHLAYPALVAGTLGPAVLYLGLRSFGYERSISFLMGAAYAVADIAMLYSGRVKPYVFDPLLVLGIVFVVTRLAPRTWRWSWAAAWIVVSCLLGLFSGYVLVASAAAGLIFFLHPASDRPVRLVALIGQGVGQLLFLVWAERSTDLNGIEDVSRTLYDAHLRVYLNPVTFGREVVTHLDRIVTVYPGGYGAWLTILAFLALGGLVIASVRGMSRVETLAARTCLLMLAIAFVGALVGKFPFGPKVYGVAVSSGGRHTLWLVPVVAVGLASVLHRARAAVASRVDIWPAFDVAVIVAALAVLVLGYHQPVAYPFPGSRTAARYVAAHMRPGDVVLITSGNVYSFAESSGLKSTLKATPDREIGFTPVFSDRRVHTFTPFGVLDPTPSQVRSLVSSARRVVVEGGGALGAGNGAVLNTVLKSEGFHSTERLFGTYAVDIWER
jgi:hypothetical protein